MNHFGHAEFGALGGHQTEIIQPGGCLHGGEERSGWWRCSGRGVSAWMGAETKGIVEITTGEGSMEE